MLTNYHTHTFRCHHAGDTPDEAYVTAAIENGYSILGFSDHTPWPYTSGYVSSKQRMTMEEFPEYLRSISTLRDRYADRISIKIGLECEYFPQFMGWLAETKPKLDFLLLGNHFGLSDEHGEPYYGGPDGAALMEEYTAYTVAGMDTGLFDCLAHPELPFADYPVFDALAAHCAHIICREAKALCLPLEYNLYGTLKQDRGIQSGLGYPAKEFWQVAAELGCTAIIGVDAHNPGMLADVARIRRAEDFLTSLGIRLIKTL